MNKKLLLVSLLAVGMLVGCGGKGDGSSVVPSSETPVTSEDGGETNWTGKYGNAGYYLVGEVNGWNNFWKYDGFEDFEFSPTDDANVFTLTISFTAEFLASDAVAGDAAGAVDFKVMYWDGNKAPSEWWPDGVANNGVISEAGEYKLTFNKASTETADKTDGSGTYTKFTSWERVGDAKAETAFVQGDARQFEATYGKVTYKVAVEEGLTIPEGCAVLIHTWGLANEEGTDVSGYFELTEGAGGVWSYTTPEAVVTDDGTGVGMDYGFCIIVDAKGSTTQDWSKKVSNSASSDGNYKIHVTTNKLSGTDQLKKADKPYWTKGERDNPYTVEEAKAVMDAEGFVDKTVMAVTGVVKSVDKYNEKYNSYNLTLETPANEDGTSKFTFMLYSIQLEEGVAAPKEGYVVSAFGPATIYNGTYEIHYKPTQGYIYKTEIKIGELDYLYVRGSMSDWACKPAYKLVETEVPGVYSVTVTLATGDQFKLANNTDDWAVQFGPSALVVDAAAAEYFDVTDTAGNVKVAKDGTFTFTYDITGETPVASVKLAA